MTTYIDFLSLELTYVQISLGLNRFWLLHDLVASNVLQMMKELLC